MINYQKKPILVKENPTIIRKPANGKHNEVTVAIVKYALPFASILPNGVSDLSKKLIESAVEATNDFQIDVRFNHRAEAPALLFAIKAKTERRGDDVPNQELADKIVMAKADARASSLAARAVAGIRKYLAQRADALTSIIDVFQGYAARELSYIQKV